MQGISLAKYNINMCAKAKLALYIFVYISPSLLNKYILFMKRVQRV